jgi:ribosomal protein S18 acetylase RimI-like enzyme
MEPSANPHGTLVIQQVEQVTQEILHELLAAFERLIPQLTTEDPLPTRVDLEEMLANPWCSLFTARLPDGPIVGVLALITYRTPTGMRAVIENLVVDETARCRGIGEALTRAAMSRARDCGAQFIALTSHPTNLEGNRLYQRLGFVRPQTNFYRYYFER